MSAASLTWRRLVRSVRFGPAVITVVLVVIGVVRALAVGARPSLVIIVALAFAVWFFAGIVTSARGLHRSFAPWWLAVLALLWCATVAVSAEFVWLAFPLWLMAGFVLRMRWAIVFSIIVFAIVVGAPVVHVGATPYANVIGPLVGGIFALGISRGYLEILRDSDERARLVASLLAANEEATALHDELARMQRESGATAERTRLSRDIHDTVAQNLSSIGMIAQSAADRADEPGAAALAQIRELAHEALTDTRRIVNALMPAQLEGSALSDALRRIAGRLERETGVDAVVLVDGNLRSLPIAAEVALLRTAQSALANVRQHAEATRVVLNLADVGDAVRLDIVDDGVGFDPKKWRVSARTITEGGYGLRAMRDRLRELGGDLEVESAPGEGTALAAHVPLIHSPSTGRDAAAREEGEI